MMMYVIRMICSEGHLCPLPYILHGARILYNDRCPECEPWMKLNMPRSISARKEEEGTCKWDIWQSHKEDVLHCIHGTLSGTRRKRSFIFVGTNMWVL